jgi:hypothetical protein
MNILTPKDVEHLLMFILFIQSLSESSTGVSPVMMRQPLFPVGSKEDNSSSEIYHLELNGLSHVEYNTILNYFADHHLYGFVFQLFQFPPLANGNHNNTIFTGLSFKQHQKPPELAIEKGKTTKLTCVNCKINNIMIYELFTLLEKNKNWPESVALKEAIQRREEFDLCYRMEFNYNALAASPSSDSSSSSPSGYRFVDLSNGMRLFHAYALGQKDRKMKILLEASLEEEDEKKKNGKDSSKNSVTALVPGSVTWKLQKDREVQEQASKKKVNEEDEFDFKKQKVPAENIKSVPIDTKTSGWNIVELGDEDDDARQSNSTKKKVKTITKHEMTLENFGHFSYQSCPWARATLSSRSLIATSQLHVERYENTGQQMEKVGIEPVYGICYTAMVFVNGGNKTIFCEGNTLFPSIDWTRRGLLSMGKSLEDGSMEIMDEDYYVDGTDEENEEEEGDSRPAKTGKNNKKSENTRTRRRQPPSQLCRNIFERLISLKNYRIHSKKEIIQLVDELFLEYQ